MNRQSLIIPDSYEDIVTYLGHDRAKLMQFIVRVREAENAIAMLLEDMIGKGYLLFIFGFTGTGKSTFINSLDIYQYLSIRQIIGIDADRFVPTPDKTKLQQLRDRIREIAAQESERLEKGKHTCLVINYLENLSDELEGDVKAFFRDLNPILRRTPILILWPVTEETDLSEMCELARSVSNTILSHRLPVLDFNGPLLEEYPAIARKTIEVFNDTQQLEEIGLTYDDLFMSLRTLKEAGPKERTIRHYLRRVKQTWEKRSGELDRLTNLTPKRTEVWFVVCYPDAEERIRPFYLKSWTDIDANWRANYQKLSEYARRGKRQAQWAEDRLLMALNLFQPKIMYMPTNALINALCAYGEDVPGFPLSKEDFLRDWHLKKDWMYKAKSRIALARSPIIRQLARVEPQVGDRSKSSARDKALDEATLPFDAISRKIPSPWSDTPFNVALMYALKDAYMNPTSKAEPLPEDRPNLRFSAEQAHPYYNLVPDIMIELDDRIVCIEMHYTQQTQDHILAGYCLDKLDAYMDQHKSLIHGRQLQLTVGTT